MNVNAVESVDFFAYQLKNIIRNYLIGGTRVWVGVLPL